MGRGIEFYAPCSKRDLLFDKELIAIKEALRTVEGRTSLDGVPIDSGVRATLERLMPIYRKYWWPAHDRTNREWIAAVRPLIDRHGAARELKAHGIDYTHFAHPDIYTRMCGVSCEERMAVHWTPHLDGKRSIAESLSALVASFK